MDKHPSSLRNERSGRKGRSQSERRGNYRASAKWTTCRVVGLCDGALLLLAQRKTAFEKRIGKELDEPSMPFGTLVEYIPITAKDKSRIHQFGQQTLKGVFFSFVLRAGGSWSDDLAVASYEELQESEAAEINVERFCNCATTNDLLNTPS